MAAGYAFAAGVIEQTNLKPLLDRVPGARKGLAKQLAKEFASQKTGIRMLRAGGEQGFLESVEELSQNAIGNAGKKYTYCRSDTRKRRSWNRVA